jgi:hypothetical protein
MDWQTGQGFKTCPTNWKWHSHCHIPTKKTLPLQLEQIIFVLTDRCIRRSKNKMPLKALNNRNGVLRINQRKSKTSKNKLFLFTDFCLSP